MTLAPETPPGAVTPPIVLGGPQAAPDAPPRTASGAAAPHLGSFLAELRYAFAACGCCPALVDNEQQLREIRVRHPEEFSGPASEPPNEHPDVEWDRLIDEGLRIPLDERDGGMVYESWL